ncbi:MAG: gliding motility-associated C-terminal domain-containing protein [Bacteroidetes bacterium]|nr:gliding motility-associated C-terminal domain-containing protein [Bacteroidota bacterium]
MKKISLIHLLVLTGFILSFINTNSQITFQRTYGYSMMDMFSSVQQTNDNGFILSGTSMETMGLNFSGSVVKTDANGNLSWGKNLSGVFIDNPWPIPDYTDGCSYMINYIRQTSDNGYILTGQISPSLTSVNVNYTDAVLVKLTSAGVVSWTYHYGGSDYDIGNFVMQTSDGGYLVAGSTYSFGTKDSLNIFILKTNSTGALTWEKTIQVNTVDDDVAVTAEEVSDGFIIGGYSEQVNGSDTLADMVLLKANKTTGAVSWLYTYGANADDERIYDITLSTVNSNELLVTGYTTQSGASNALLMKVNVSNGSVISSTSYFSNWLSAADEGHSIQNTSDGGIAVIGFSVNIIGGMYSLLLKTDNTGNTVSLAKAYNNGFMGMQFFSAGQQTNDGGYVIGNMGPGALAWDFGLIKTDAAGVSGCNEDNVTPTQEACTFSSEVPSPAYTTYTGATSASITGVIGNITITDGTLCCTPLPDNAGAITGLTTVCQGQNGVPYTVSAITNATGYNWTLPSGASISSGANTNSITVNFSAGATSGNITVNGTNDCGNGIAYSIFITVNAIPAAAGTITGTSPVCQGQSGVTYTVPVISGATYQWSVPTGASITSGSGTNTITVNFSASASSGNISVYGTNSCGNGNSSSYPVTVSTLPGAAGAISGTATICQGESNIAYSVPSITGATGYTWTLPTGASIASGTNTNSIAVNFSGTAISGNVTVYGTNTCGNGTAATFPVTVNTLPQTTGPITGTAQVCQTDMGIVYSVPAMTGATGYTWAVPSGAVIVSGTNTNTITVNFSDTAISGNITVSGTNTCGNGNSLSYPVTVSALPVAAGAINGTDTVCQGQTGVTYTVAAITNATNYQWSLPSGATIVSGSGTNTITVNYSSSASSGNISVYGSNYCGTGDSSIYPVTVTILPDSAGGIHGVTTVCQGDSNVIYFISEIPGATGYNWTLPSGATISSGSNTDSITVNYSGTSTSGTIMVTGINSCGSGTSSSLPITVNSVPPTPGAITGDNQVCQTETGIVYTVPVITGATGYVWSVPSGITITGGTNTNTITVAISDTAISGNITVYATNSCGIGNTSSYPVTVSSLPANAGIIFGTSVLCQGTSGVTYSVAPITGATNYVWTLPAGAVIATGSNTYSITVNFSDTASSGIVSVYGMNYCGNGDSSAFAVTVDSIPVFALAKTDISCNGENDGAAWIQLLSGLQPPVTYIWTPTGSVNDTISNLTPGLYTVMITNGANCQKAGTVNIIEPLLLMVAITGDSTLCYNSNDGSALAVVSGGTTPYTYAWSDNNSTTTPDVTGLSSNVDYVVVVIDHNNCIAGDTIMIYSPTQISTGITSTTPTNCYAGSDGAATIWSSGGTGAHTYQWSGTSGNTGSTATGLSAGNYHVTVTDANNCSEIIYVTITQPSQIVVAYTTDSTSCPDANDGSIRLSVTGGIRPYAYSWDGTSSSDSVKTGLVKGSYIITVTDNHNCIETETITIYAEPDICLEIPSAFTPNTDGNNDTWDIKGIEYYPNCIIEIYNRWGNLIFESKKGYNTPWDGKYNNKEVATGPYIYIVNLNNGTEPHVGTVTVIR